MQTDCRGKPLIVGTFVTFNNIHGQPKVGCVTAILPTCIKVWTTFRYWDHGKECAGEGAFPVVPTDCTILDDLGG
jgi:hypothetical protein